MSTKEKLLKVIAGIIAALFFYAAMSKLVDLDKSRQEMRNQVFPTLIADVLWWLVPLTELVLVSLLLYLPSRLRALYGSVALLSAFTIYIAITMTGVFGRVPCSCGGILSHMGYGTHLLFNLVFIGLALGGIAIDNEWKAINRWLHPNKERRLRQLNDQR